MLLWNFIARKRLREANSASMPYYSASKTVCAVQQKGHAQRGTGRPMRSACRGEMRGSQDVVAGRALAHCTASTLASTSSKPSIDQPVMA